MGRFREAHFREFLTQRRDFLTIDDFARYKRARVQLHGKGIVLRDDVLGSEIKTKKQQPARSGELLVAEIDAKVGGFGIVPPELEGAIVSSHYFLFEVNEQICHPGWLNWYVRSGQLEEQVTAQGSTNYAAIRPSDVLEYKLPLPPIVEQQRIVARIEALAGRVDESRGLRREVEMQRGAIIPSALHDLFETKSSDWEHMPMLEAIAVNERQVDPKLPTCGPTVHPLHFSASAWHTKRLSQPPVHRLRFRQFAAVFWPFLSLLTLFCKPCTVGSC